MVTVERATEVLTDDVVSCFSSIPRDLFCVLALPSCSKDYDSVSVRSNSSINSRMPQQVYSDIGVPVRFDSSSHISRIPQYWYCIHCLFSCYVRLYLYPRRLELPG